MYILTDITTQTIKVTESLKLAAFLKLIYISRHNQISTIILGNLNSFVLKDLVIASIPYNDVLAVKGL